MATGTGAVGERAASVAGDRTTRPGPRTRRRVTLSLRNRLALVFSAITFLALAALYVYVAPGLETRLLSDQLSELTADAQHHSAAIARTVGSNDPLPVVQTHVNAAALATGDRVTLLLVNHVPSGAVLSELADSSRRSATAALSFEVAKRAVAASRMITGTEETGAGNGRRGREPRLVPRSRGGGDRVLGARVGHRPHGRDSPPPDPGRGRDRAAARARRELADGAGARPARQAPRARGRAGRRGRLRAADPGRLERRVGAARGGVQPDAAPALAARVGAQEVHRDRVARAPHPDLFVGWFRRAARRSRPRSGDPGAVPGAGPRPGGTAAQAVGRPAGSVPARVGVLWSCDPSRSTSAS